MWVVMFLLACSVAALKTNSTLEFESVHVAALRLLGWLLVGLLGRWGQLFFSSSLVRVRDVWTRHKLINQGKFFLKECDTVFAEGTHPSPHFTRLLGRTSCR